MIKRRVIKFKDWKVESRKIKTWLYHISFDGNYQKVILEPIKKKINELDKRID